MRNWKKETSYARKKRGKTYFCICGGFSMWIVYNYIER